MLRLRRDLLVLCLLLLNYLSAFASELPALPREVPCYDIVLEVDFGGRRFSGVERIEYVNTTGIELEEVFLRLYPNASAIYGTGLLSVEETLLNGEPVEVESFVDGTVLMVPLSFPLSEGESIALELSFNGRPSEWLAPSNPSPQVGYGIYASSKRAMSLASFYPILAVYDEEGWNIDPISEIGDPVFSAVASYTVSVTTDPGLSVLSSGRLVDQEVKGDRCTYRFIGEGVRDFIIVLGEGYVQRSEHAGEVVLRTSFFPKHAHAGQIAMVRARAALALYERLFGPYAYDELDLVEVPLARAAGVEYPGLILIAESYCENPADRFFDIIVSHEVAHQWWYAAVGSDVIEEPWLDESLATYSSALFIEETYGTEAARAVFADWAASHRSVRDSHPGLSVASPLYLFPDSGTYRAFIYSGGAVFLNEIRRTIGDAAFFDALAAYYHNRAFRFAHSSDLLTHFEEACACDLSEIFSYYLRHRR